ncbi:MAG: HDOD domain-containing protein [Epsilonproteobacteria bacterium]|nr:hypothetical protein [Campylobacterota bacterium]NPA57508.1 HDOD domain-containing protein [Campylobacterota bacterium]
MIEQLIESIEGLPPVPSVVHELQNLYYYDDYNTSDIEQVLRKDPNLVANILKIANSPYYGIPREFIEIRQAIAYFGLEQIIEFALESFVNNLIKLDLSFYHIGPMDFIAMSRRKVEVVKKVGRTKRDRFVLSSTAFLSDISKVLISNYGRERGLELEEGDHRLNLVDEMERELLGFDTIQVSLKIFEYWNFDREMIDLLAGFKEYSNPREEALFLAREIVTLKGNIDGERLKEYGEYERELQELL